MSRAIWVLVAALMVAMVGVMAWQPPQSSGEWASWAQAIGTVAALFGVLWVAHADGRRKHREQVALAAVTAVVLMRTMPELIAAVAVTVHSLAAERPDEALVPRLRALRGALDGGTLPSEEQMLRIVPLDPLLGQSLAHAVGAVTQARNVFTLILSDAEDDPPDEVRQGAANVLKILRTALDGLQWCSAELHKSNAEHVMPAALRRKAQDADHDPKPPKGAPP